MRRILVAAVLSSNGVSIDEEKSRSVTCSSFTHSLDFRQLIHKESSVQAQKSHAIVESIYDVDVALFSMQKEQQRRRCATCPSPEGRRLL